MCQFLDWFEYIFNLRDEEKYDTLIQTLYKKRNILILYLVPNILPRDRIGTATLSMALLRDTIYLSCFTTSEHFLLNIIESLCYQIKHNE